MSRWWWDGGGEVALGVIFLSSNGLCEDSGSGSVRPCQAVVMTLPCNYRCRNLRKFSTRNEGGRVGRGLGPGAPHYLGI